MRRKPTTRHHRRAPRPVLSAAAALAPLLLLACGGEEPPPARSRPSSYGIDEVTPASARATTPRPPIPSPPLAPPTDVPKTGSPDGATDREKSGFLLPELGIAPGDGGDHLGQGQQLFARRGYLEAAAHLSVAAEESPESWYVHYLLGLSLWKAGDLDGGEGGLRRAAELNPGFPKTFVNLSRLLNDAGRHGEALAAADRAVDLVPDDPTGLYLRGRSLANLGRNHEAEEALRASLRLDPHGGHVHNRLGLLLLQQERFQEAVTPLEKAAELLPEVAYVRNNLGMAYERTGRTREAAAQYAQGVRLDGEHPRLLANLERIRPLLDHDPLLALGEVEQKSPERAALEGPDGDGL